jgi:hypothetical protein
MRRNLIIVGMSRSGTSLTAAIFARRGYFVGVTENADTNFGRYRNPFGYFEADELVNENVKLLHAAGYPFHNTWLFEPISASTVEEIYRFQPSEQHRRFVQAYDEVSPWVWKDPRLCFTLPYWWKLVNQHKSGVVLVYRDPYDIYLSFRRLGWCPSGRAAQKRVFARIEQHASAASNAIDSLKIPYISVDYADYIRAPTLVAERLSDFCGSEISVEDLNVRPELDHSNLKGRITTYVRLALKKLPQRRIKRLESLLPGRVIALIFPESKYVDKTTRGIDPFHK